jgi:hypothetical protein
MATALAFGSTIGSDDFKGRRSYAAGGLAWQAAVQGYNAAIIRGHDRERDHLCPDGEYNRVSRRHFNIPAASPAFFRGKQR